jgi:acyl-CoA dehydrogenase
MNLSFSHQEREFELAVTQFLANALPARVKTAHNTNSSLFVDRNTAQHWQKILVDKGWAAPHWPEEYGGTGWTPVQHYLFSRAYYRAGAPMLMPQGTIMLAPILFAYGTEEQKAHYLPKILSGEHYWCQGYSEAGSGSDLAGLALKAEPNADGYLLNGSKLWTTHAHQADHMFCLVRTASTAKPQQGISFLLVDMSTPGISIEPIITMAGEHEVNEVVFTNVQVAETDRIGAENAGWKYARTLLEFERGGSFSSHRISYDMAQLKRLIADTESHSADFDRQGSISRKLAHLDIQLKALEISELRYLLNDKQHGSPGDKSAIVKLQSARLEQAINELAVEVARYSGVAMDAIPENGCYRADFTSSIVPRYLNNRAQSIFGGSNEIMLNLIARTELGL